MTIEGLGKKFQEARVARKLTLDEAARMTKIRPSRLAEIEADDFSQFPSLTYAKGFLQIYGRFLDVDVSPYMEAFEGSGGVTVDGYSYLQDNPAPPPVRAPVVHRRPMATPRTSSGPTSLMPLIFGIVFIIVGIMGMKFILNLRRIAPPAAEQKTAASATPPYTSSYYSTPVSTPIPQPTVAPKIASTPTVAPTIAAVASPQATAGLANQGQPTATAVVAASTAPASVAPTATAAPKPAEPEVRKAVALAPGEAAKKSTTDEGSGPNKIAIRPLKKTYIKVVADKETPYERWISPSDPPLEFKGQHFSIRVLDREAVQIKKNGKSVTDDDSDVTIE